MRFPIVSLFVVAFSAVAQAQFAIPLISYIVATGVSSDLIRGTLFGYNGNIVSSTTIFVESNFVISYLEGAVNSARTQGALLPIDSSLVTSSLTTTQSQLIGMLSAMNSVYRVFVNDGSSAVWIVQLNRIRDLSQQLGAALLTKVGAANQAQVNAFSVTVTSSITNTVTLLSLPRRESDNNGTAIEKSPAQILHERDQAAAAKVASTKCLVPAA